jgi:ABC-type amino acid transport system permease subunit
MAENAPVADTASKKAAAAKLRKRLNLDLSPEAYDLLQSLSDESGKNMAEVLRTGLALYGIAQEEKKKGRSLGVVEDERVVKEIVIP